MEASMELTIGLRLGKEIALRFVYCLMTIGVTTYSYPVTAQDDANTILAQARPQKKPKPLPQKPKATPSQKSVVAVDEVRDPEEEGPAQLPPVIEYESVKLIDGSEIQLEKWGDTFEACEYRAPVDLDDTRIEEIVWYKNVGGGGPDGMQVDSKGEKLYWSEPHGRRPDGRIMCCSLNGKNITPLVTGLSQPRYLVLDAVQGHLYWLEGVQTHSLKVAELNGKGVRTIVEGLNSPFGLAIDSERGELYYWEEPGRVVRIKTNGTGEYQVISGDQDQLFKHFMRGMFWDQKDQTLLTFGGGLSIRSIGREATAAKNLFLHHLGSDYSHMAVDVTRGQVALPDRIYGQLVRVNMDGSGREVVAMSPKRVHDVGGKSIGGSVALDELRNTIYFDGSHYSGTDLFAAIFRMKLPPRFKRHILPAPPIISAVAPPQIKAGNSLLIRGAHFQFTKAVTFVDDGNFKHVEAKFVTDTDDSINVTVPIMSETCQNPLLIVETPSGVTMTLRKDLKVVRNAGGCVHNRLQSKPLSQLWATSTTGIANAESAVVYVEPDATCDTRTHGQSVLFLKNGSFCPVNLPNCVVYHEPFIRWGRIAEIDPSCKVHAVPAIRPSFIDETIKYERR
jgi:hypothetical protein